MKLNCWMAAKAIVEIVFGLGFLILPVKLASIFGMDLNPGGALMAQLFGTMFIFGSIVLWISRNEPLSNPVIKIIVNAVVISNAIGFIVTLMGSLSGAWNALGWIPVIVFLLCGLGFAYFLFPKKTE